MATTPVDDRATPAGAVREAPRSLRAIAAFEASKGVGALLLGAGLLALGPDRLRGHVAALLHVLGLDGSGHADATTWLGASRPTRSTSRSR